MRIHITEITMNHSVNKLASIFKEMVKNRQTMGCQWKNIALGKEAFGIMKQLPDTLPGEYDSPEKKAELLSQMLDQMEETESARFCIEVREYIALLSPQDEHNFAELQKLRDYTDPSMPMEEYCKRYRRLLVFGRASRSRGRGEQRAERRTARHGLLFRLLGGQEDGTGRTRYRMALAGGNESTRNV